MSGQSGRHPYQIGRLQHTTWRKPLSVRSYWRFYGGYRNATRRRQPISRSRFILYVALAAGLLFGLLSLVAKSQELFISPITQVTFTNIHLPIPKDKPLYKSKSALWSNSKEVAAIYNYAKIQKLSEQEIIYLLEVLQRESSFSTTAVNPTSGACGLFQRLPCSVKIGDFDGQMADGLAYIKARYGTAQRAWKFWLDHGSY